MGCAGSKSEEPAKPPAVVGEVVSPVVSSPAKAMSFEAKLSDSVSQPPSMAKPVAPQASPSKSAPPKRDSARAAQLAAEAQPVVPPPAPSVLSAEVLEAPIGRLERLAGMSSSGAPGSGDVVPEAPSEAELASLEGLVSRLEAVEHSRHHAWRDDAVAATISQAVSQAVSQAEAEAEAPELLSPPPTRRSFFEQLSDGISKSVKRISTYFAEDENQRLANEFQALVQRLEAVAGITPAELAGGAASGELGPQEVEKLEGMLGRLERVAGGALDDVEVSRI